MALEFRIEVDDKGTPKVTRFRKEMQKSGTTADKLSKSLKFVAGGLAVGGTAALAASAGVFALTKRSAESQDALGKLANSLDFSVEGLSAYHHIAELGGQSTDAFDKAIVKATKSLGDARTGLSTPKRALEELGAVLDKDLVNSGKNVEQLLPDIAEGFKLIEDPVLRNRIAMDLFGRSGSAMVTVLGGGSEAIKEMTRDAQRYGRIVDAEAAANSAKFNDTLLELESTISGQLRVAANSVMPEITDLMTDLTNTIVENREDIQGFGEDLVGAFKSALPIVEGVASGVGKVLGFIANSDLKGELEKAADLEGLTAKLKITPLEKVTERDRAAAREEKRLIEETKKAAIAGERARLAATARAKTERQKLIAESVKIENGLISEQFEKEMNLRLEGMRRSDENLRARLRQESAFSQERKRILDEIHLASLSQADRDIELATRTFNEKIQIVGFEPEMVRQFTEEVERIREESAARQLQATVNAASQTSEILSNVGQALRNINDAEQERIRNRFEEREELLQEQLERDLAAAGENEERKEAIRKASDDKLKQLDLQKNQALQNAARETAGLRKGIAIVEATINGAVAFTKALTAGPFIGPPLAASIAALTATQVGLISAQKFQFGGFPQGRNALIQVNENGRQESVLNADATEFLGRNAITSLNRGRSDEFLQQIAENTGSAGQPQPVTINVTARNFDRRFVEDELLPLMESAGARK